MTAHSGADDTADNSREYLDYILTTGVDASEIDVRYARDTLVLSHDPVADGQDVVTLAEAFALLAAAPEMRMNCDLKTPGLEAAVYEAAVDAQVADRILFSGSVSVARMREAGLLGRVEVYLNIEETVPVPEDFSLRGMSVDAQTVHAACQVCADAGIRVMNVPAAIVDEAFLRILHGYGLNASVWTVDDMDEAARFIALHVESITTKKAADLTALLSRMTDSD